MDKLPTDLILEICSWLDSNDCGAFLQSAKWLTTDFTSFNIQDLARPYKYKHLPEDSMYICLPVDYCRCENLDYDRFTEEIVYKYAYPPSDELSICLSFLFSTKIRPYSRQSPLSIWDSCRRGEILNYNLVAGKLIYRYRFKQYNNVQFRKSIFRDFRTLCPNPPKHLGKHSLEGIVWATNHSSLRKVILKYLYIGESIDAKFLWCTCAFLENIITKNEYIRSVDCSRRERYNF
jgi:hypothetical protein